jgi:hypothetical protein
MFTQCVTVLFERAPTLADLKSVIAVETTEAPAAEAEQGWVLTGPSLTLDHRKDVNGKLQIDVIDVPFPDAMGSPDREPTLFAAWSMGHFGPTTYPGALERASLHEVDRELVALTEKHTAFVRIRVSYVLGASSEAPVLPDHYDPIHELAAVSELAVQIGGVDGALVIFNPNAERLLTAQRLRTALDRAPILPVDVWTSARRVRPQQLPDWLIFDTVGMGQLDVADHQLVLPIDHGTAEHAPALLCSMAAYDAAHGGVLSPGDTASDTDGRGVTAEWASEATLGPPRAVLAWVPDDLEEIPEELDQPDLPEA